jgi:hypothetical protein
MRVSWATLSKMAIKGFLLVCLGGQFDDEINHLRTSIVSRF